jgi:ATP adenylyltransferase
MAKTTSDSQTEKYDEITNKFSRANSARPFDLILLETEDYLVTPCLGSIVPNWVIVWPRRKFLNCREWKGDAGFLRKFSHDVVKILLNDQQGEFLWFEHGCESIGSVTGCGINFAHLHILIEPPFTFNAFERSVKQLSKSNWDKLEHFSDMPNRHSKTDYHIFGDPLNSLILQDSNHLGSQFFRRVVALLSGENEKWNYRNHSFRDNADSTVLNLYDQQ